MAVCLAFASCSKSKNEEPDPIETQARRTVIVYMAANHPGNSDLASYVAGDFQQMLEGSASMPSDGNLILYIDRTGSQGPCIVSIKNEKADTISVATENTYSSDPTVMIDVLSSIMDEYPADDYGLVLWGHADGWLIEDSIEASQTKTRSFTTTQADKPIRKAFGVDNKKWMNIPTLANVLSTLPNKFKYIFADCCCFQSVESAYELRNVADYIIGSPAEIPGVGAPYNTVVPALFDYTDTFYKSIVDAYAEQVLKDNYGQTYKEPLSVIKTSEMENLAQATAPLLKVVAEKGGVNQYDEIAYYFSSSISQYPYFYKLLYDMQDLFMNYVDDANLYANWKTAFDQAVVYKNFANPWVTSNYVDFDDFTLTESNYGGVSIFIPASYYPSIYNIGIKKMAWYYATGMDDYFSNVE